MYVGGGGGTGAFPVSTILVCCTHKGGEAYAGPCRRGCWLTLTLCWGESRGQVVSIHHSVPLENIKGSLLDSISETNVFW